MKKRLNFITFCFLIIGFGFMGKIASLQLFQHKRLKKEVRQVSMKKVRLTPNRGTIYDRNMRILATTIDNKRIYPRKSLCGNLLGFVGTDGEGLEGIEYKLDEYLKGKQGWKIVGKTPMGKPYSYPGYREFAPFASSNIVLTIDADVQEIAEDELKKQIEVTNAKSGDVIVISAQTGEILAMATYPVHNPGMGGKGSSRKWRNRPVTDLFEPGSTLKLLTISGLLRHNLVNITDIVEDGKGFIEVCGRRFEDNKEHSPLSFEEAVWHSSNVAFINLANMLGRRNLYLEMRAYGFGTPTGVELPGEPRQAISLPDNWSGIKFANLAFGQGMSCTSLQLAMAYSIVANDGLFIKPRIIKQIISTDNRIIYESKKEIVREVITKEIARTIRELLYGVVENGTGKLAKIKGVSIAGKTGTAQKWRTGAKVAFGKSPGTGKYHPDEYVSSFIGFFPVADPNILILILINEPKNGHLGSIISAPLFRRIAQRIIRVKKLEVEELKVAEL